MSTSARCGAHSHDQDGFDHGDDADGGGARVCGGDRGTAVNIVSDDHHGSARAARDQNSASTNASSSDNAPVDAPTARTLDVIVQNLAGTMLHVTLPFHATSAHLKQHVHAHKQWLSDFSACACAACELTPDRQRLAVMRVDLHGNRADNDSCTATRASGDASDQAPLSEKDYAVLDDARSLSEQGVASHTTVHLYVAAPAWRTLVDEFLLGNCTFDVLERRHGGAATCAPLWHAALVHAQQHHSEAKWQCVIGVCYYWPRGGVTRDYALAVQWYERAAAAGLVRAYSTLAFCYGYGEGVKKNPARAAELFELAADRGLAVAQYNLAFCYFQGSGVKKNVARAAQLFQLAADQGDAHAQRVLAGLYSAGEGVSQDLARAAALMEQAAAQGQAESQFALGHFFFAGHGVAQDAARAVHWWQLAADQGNENARLSLAQCFRDGIGVAPDAARAAQLWHAAADLGHPEAQFEVGVCYRDGSGLERDTVLAAHFFQRAAETGHVQAIEALEALDIE